MTRARKELGSWGEEQAKQYLIKEYGYKLLNQNWRNRAGEIDLIMLDRDTLVFIEVRTKSSITYGTSIESLTPQKKNKLKRMASHYIQYKNCWEREIRFDFIAIDKLQNETKITYIKEIII